jgi:DNA-binding helix-hairpin-helix protein with protein kinase domain
LLFMGRHPFAGRYHGAGDMPIEKAIAEGRFAFGRLAQSYQMTPPPHSLPLTAMPSPLVDMFERAFARASARPSAFEWRQVLVNLKTSLKRCSVDSGHRYPNHLAYCPWCEIARAGGPNFFISVQIIAGGVTFDLPPVDVSALWARIEAVPRAAFQRPATVGRFTVKPHALPPELLDQRLFLRLVRIVCVVAAAIAASGLLLGPIAGYVGGGLVVVFGVWWAVLQATSGYQRELNRRRGEWLRLRHAVTDYTGRWDRIASRFTQEFDRAKSELWKVGEQAVQLPALFEAERRGLEAKKRDLQFQAFLDRHFIRDHKIYRIGPGRLATLISYGIETAADVDADRLEALPGFGPAIVAELLAWQNTIAARFRFDPSKQVPAAELQAVVVKYSQVLRACEARLANGRDELQKILAAAQHELADVDRQLQRLAADCAQAEADARVR